MGSKGKTLSAANVKIGSRVKLISVPKIPEGLGPRTHNYRMSREELLKLARNAMVLGAEPVTERREDQEQPGYEMELDGRFVLSIQLDQKSMVVLRENS